MKAEDTQYNVHCILNSNELIPNKNKTDYMEDNVSDRIELIVEDYISKHFPKSDWIQQLKPKNKKVFHTIMSVANKLAELRGLHARFNPIIPNPGSGTKIHLSNNQDLENPEYLNTNSTNPNVKQIETPTILWQWKKGKRTKKGTEEGGKAPEGEKGSTGGTNKVDTNIPERDLLVRTKQTIKGKTYDVLQVQTIKPDMKNEKSFFTILFTDNKENHRVSWSTVNAGGAIIWVNIATYFCKLHEIKEEKNYDSTIILPHIVQSIEEVLNPPNSKIPISYEQHIQEQSNILNEMSAALWDKDEDDSGKIVEVNSKT